MAKAYQVRVLLMRTGESTWEAQGRLGGLADVPLTQAGIDQVAKVAGELGTPKFAAVLCAPDQASIQTAKLVAGGTGTPIRQINDLAEVDIGLWEGLLERELGARCPTAYRQWSECPASVCAPSGEVPEQAAERLMDALTRALDRIKADQGAVAVVLRPLAFGLAAAGLRGETARECGTLARRGCEVQWHTVAVGGTRRGLVRATG
ncbi:MAG: histidine phosphatase family protein [Phycisphaerales bacterium]